MKFKTGIQNVYLATDLKDISLLNWIKSKTHAVSISDIQKIFDKKILVEENDILSILEQEICIEAEIFAGTQMSSWSERVIEKRFSKEGKVFSRNKFEMDLNLDPSGKNLYFDVEVCECEWPETAIEEILVCYNNSTFIMSKRFTQ